MFLSLIVCFSLFFFSGCLISVSTFFFLMVSIFFSLLSYCCVHAFWFWVFYEMSILPLLYLLIKDSPYSERYSAFWYFLGYIIFSSLPMFLSILWFSFSSGVFSMVFWSSSGLVDWDMAMLIGVLFVTKIPLPPFHSWLPMVHAEASSVVSICLSGYMMKLGVLGVCRFCTWVLPDSLFILEYAGFSLFFSSLFFFSASCELDGKRWLALMSLGHMSIIPICICVVKKDGFGLVFFYCLGHGVSAGLIFILLWIWYDSTGTRNWFLMKSGFSEGFVWRLLGVVSFCSVTSMPTSPGFFVEVEVMCSLGVFGSMLVFLKSVYLFLGSLAPLSLLSTLLTRHYSLSFLHGGFLGFMGCVFFLCFWHYVLFLLI